jgi:hypothetical protein
MIWQSIFTLYVRVLHQPIFEHLALEAPLVADFEGRQFFIVQQPVDRELVDVQIFGDLFQGEKLLGHMISVLRRLAQRSSESPL